MEINEIINRESVALLEKFKKDKTRKVPAEYAAIAENAHFVTTRQPFAQWLYTYVLSEKVSAKVSIEDKKITEAGIDKSAISPVVAPTKDLIASDDKALTSFGKLLQEKIKGGTVVDLAAGDKNSTSVERWAEIFDAKEYVGVDLSEDEVAYQSDKTTMYRIKQDNLNFISTLPDASISVFHITGLEGDEGFRHNKIKEYCQCLIKEMRRALKPDGIIAVGSGCGSSLQEQDLFTQAGLELDLEAKDWSGGHEYMHSYWVYSLKGQSI